jgi:hypothetical protein
VRIELLRGWSHGSQEDDEDLFDWFNTRRLPEPIGHIPPAEAEQRYLDEVDAVHIAAARAIAVLTVPEVPLLGLPKCVVNVHPIPDSTHGSEERFYDSWEEQPVVEVRRDAPRPARASRGSAEPLV